MKSVSDRHRDCADPARAERYPQCRGALEALNVNRGSGGAGGTPPVVNPCECQGVAAELPPPQPVAQAPFPPRRQPIAPVAPEVARAQEFGTGAPPSFVVG